MEKINAIKGAKVNCPSSEIPERIISAGHQLYHCSNDPNALVFSGKFEIGKSNHSGAIFLTPEQTIRSNCSVQVLEDLRLFIFNELSKDELSMMQEAGSGDFWAGAASLGYDGRSYDDVRDPFTKTAEGGYTNEIAIFSASVLKLAGMKQI